MTTIEALPLEIIWMIMEFLLPPDWIHFGIAYRGAYKCIMDPYLNLEYKNKWLQVVHSVDCSDQNISYHVRLDNMKKYGIGIRYSGRSTEEQKILCRKIVTQGIERIPASEFKDVLKGIRVLLVSFNNDKEHGKVQIYVNGVLRKDIDYVNGNMHGRKRVYCTDGHLIKNIGIRHRAHHGKMFVYNCDGKLTHEMGYRHGWLHGKSIEYYDDMNEVANELWYHNGDLRRMIFHM